MNDKLLSNTLTDKDIQEVRNLEGPIAILGAGGFIGSHVFLQLRNIREDVYACGLGLENNWRLSWISNEWKSKSILRFDISDDNSVSELFHSLGPKTVFNFCAYGAYERQTNSHRIHDINYLGVARILKSIDEKPVSAFINSGSSSEYGLNCNAPNEKSELRPNSEYAVAKASAGNLIKYYGEIKNIPAVQLRLYSVYGPWEDPDRLVPKIIEHGLRGQYPPLVGSTTSRDFIYVDDCLRAFVKAAQTVSQVSKGASVNVGTGKPTTIELVARIAQQQFALKAEPTFDSMPPRKWDLSNWFADVGFMEKVLNWRPSINFDEGLKFTAEWERVFQSRQLVKLSPLSLEYKKKITAVIACYKDELAIPIMYKRLVETFEKCRVNYEIIFVNDCSPYGDQQAIHQIADQDSKVVGISHSRNFGSQAAFLSGMEVSTGDAVVLFDGDLQDPPEMIEKFLVKWNEGFDVVYGVRIKREAPIYMQVLYRIFYRIFRSLADVNIPLDAGDFSLLDRKVVQKMLSLKERDFFLRGLRAWIGFKQVGVPYVRPERMFGVTTNSFMKNIWWAKKGIFSFSTKPLDYVQWIGLSVVAASFLLAIFYLVLYFSGIGDPPRGITTLFIMTLGIGGLQIFAISIIGEYVKKIIEEVKGRPRYIRSEIYRKKSDS